MHSMKRLSSLRAFRLTRTSSRVAVLPALSCRARQNHSVVAKTSYATLPTERDPYQYQVGFGNRFASEAVWAFFRTGPISITASLANDGNCRPGALPDAQNSPQRVRYGLYAEAVRIPTLASHRHQTNGTQMTGTSFIAPRAENKTAYVGCDEFSHGADYHQLVIPHSTIGSAPRVHSTRS